MDYLINLLIDYQSKDYISLILMLIGTLYVLLILLRGFLMAIVSITKTDKDNIFVNKIYNFIDKYTISLDKTVDFSKIKNTNNDKL